MPLNSIYCSGCFCYIDVKKVKRVTDNVETEKEWVIDEVAGTEKLIETTITHLWWTCPKCKNFLEKKRKKNSKVKKTRPLSDSSKSASERQEVKLLSTKVGVLEKKVNTLEKTTAVVAQKVYNPSEKDTIEQAENIRKALLQRKYGKKWLKHWRDLRQHKNQTLQDISSGFFSFLYNDYTKQQIREAKSIEQINYATSSDLWVGGSRKSYITRFIYVVFPLLLISLIVRYKKRFLAWYNAPLDEEDWEWGEDEPEEEEAEEDNDDNN